MYMSIGLLIVAIAAIGFIPFPSHVYCPLEIQARGAESVYVKVDGILEEVFVQPGDKVEPGQKLAQLRNIDIELTIADLTGKRAAHEAELEGLRLVSFQDGRAAAQVDATEEALASTTDQLKKAEDDRTKLLLVAPRAGTVLPPPPVEKRPDESTHLPTWSGSPFDEENRGALMMVGTKLCQIGEPNCLEARLIIDQNYSRDVQSGQYVEIMLDQSAEYVYVSKIEERGRETVKQSPPNLSSLNGGPLPSQMGSDGVARPIAPAIDALVPLPVEDPHGLLRIGPTGRAKISTPWRTLWARLYEYGARTFNFEL
jgi:putative peptide zinc metalloprotease protein